MFKEYSRHPHKVHKVTIVKGCQRLRGQHCTPGLSCLPTPHPVFLLLQGRGIHWSRHEEESILAAASWFRHRSFQVGWKLNRTFFWGNMMVNPSGFEVSHAVWKHQLGYMAGSCLSHLLHLLHFLLLFPLLHGSDELLTGNQGRRWANSTQISMAILGTAGSKSPNRRLANKLAKGVLCLQCKNHKHTGDQGNDSRPGKSGRSRSARCLSSSNRMPQQGSKGPTVSMAEWSSCRCGPPPCPHSKIGLCTPERLKAWHWRQNLEPSSDSSDSWEHLRISENIWDGCLYLSTLSILGCKRCRPETSRHEGRNRRSPRPWMLRAQVASYPWRGSTKSWWFPYVSMYHFCTYHIQSYSNFKTMTCTIVTCGLVNSARQKRQRHVQQKCIYIQDALRAAFKPPKFKGQPSLCIDVCRYILFHLECQTVPSAVSAQDMPIIAMI